MDIVEIVQRQVDAYNKVIDHERIHGIGDHPIEALGIYEISAGLIENVWFFYPDQPLPLPNRSQG